MRICAGCQQPILASFVTALRKSWHPNCFRCAHCQQPFADGRFYTHQGKPYCKEDYFAYIAERCAFCQQPIRGSYHKTKEGFKICYKRDALHRICFSCHTSQHMQPQQKFSKTSDNRYFCPTCQQTLVNHPAEVNNLFLAVIQDLAALGFSIDAAKVDLKTADRPGLRQQTRSRSWPGPLGLTIADSTRRLPLLGQNTTPAVIVLTPLPCTHLGMVLAHESVHVWLHQQRFPRLSKQTEEGLAELIASLWLARQTDPLAATLSHSLHNSTSRIYGSGLRKMLRAYERLGLPALLELLRKKRSLP